MVERIRDWGVAVLAGVVHPLQPVIRKVLAEGGGGGGGREEEK